MMQSAHKVTGGVLWRTTPAVLADPVPADDPLDRRSGMSPWPVAAFGLVLSQARPISYLLLERALIAAEGRHLRRDSGRSTRSEREWVSFAGLCHRRGVCLRFTPILSVAIYVAVAFLWLVPDRRFVRRLVAAVREPSPHRAHGKVSRNDDPRGRRRAAGRSSPATDRSVLGNTGHQAQCQEGRRIGETAKVIGGFAGATA
jgi:hypothetical protein